MITDTVIVFSDEDHARRGLGMLKALQAEGILALYGSAVVVKEPTGHLSVQAAEGGPFGMTVGGISGLLAGLLAGPLGAAIGAAGGAAAGAVHETHEAQYRSEALEQVSGQMASGGSAVVAQVAEFGDARLEERMRALGGLLLHGGRIEAEYQDALREFQTLHAAIDQAQADYAATLARAAAEREARLTGARTQLSQAAQRLSLLGAVMQQQTDARIAQLQQRPEQYGWETKMDLDRQVAQICSDQQLRLAGLKEAWASAEAALGPE